MIDSLRQQLLTALLRAWANGELQIGGEPATLIAQLADAVKQPAMPLPAQRHAWLAAMMKPVVRRRRALQVLPW